MTGHFKPEEMTAAQKAFWIGMTDQRVANMWEAADDWADLKPEAKDLLRNAEPTTLRWLERASEDDIKQLQYSVKFLEASRLLGRFMWFVVASLFGAVIAVMTFWEKLQTFLKAKT
jgi:hypothetical protein